MVAVPLKGQNKGVLTDLKRNAASPGRSFAIVVGAFSCLMGWSAVLADTATRFVDRLREEGHADLVLEYLDRAAEDPLVSAAFRERIGYERLATLYAQAVAVRDAANRRAALEALAPEIEALAATSPEAATLLTDATDRIATAAADAARRSALRALASPEGAERERSLAAARDELEAARGELSEAERLIVAERVELKGVAAASPEGRRRQELGARLGLVRLLRARLIHERAETHPEGSKERDRLNRQAAEELGALYDKYAKWGVGLYAQLYEGRCYRLLGERQLAASALEGLTSQPAPNAELRRIVTLAHAENAALLTDIGKPAEALGRAREWLDGLPPREDEGTEAATLRYRLAVAALKVAAKAEEADARRLRRDAREWLADSARTPSEVQADARARWAALGAESGRPADEPKTFGEAYALGKDAIGALAIASQGDAETDAARRRAAQALEAALGLVDDEATDEQLAEVRYWLAYLDWLEGADLRAIVRAEYVARNTGDASVRADAARLAMAALERRRAAEPERADAIAERLRSLASYVLGRWPGEAVAESASAILLGEALRSGDLAAAERVLGTVPAEQRAELALRLAVAQWEGVRKRPAAERTQERKRLAEAFEAASAAEPTSLQVTAALYLAQAALDEGDAARAERFLKDKQTGPLTRARTGAAPADTTAFKLATLTAAVRTAALRGNEVDATIDRFARLVETAPEAETGGRRAWLSLAVALLADLQASREAAGAAASSAASTLAKALDRLGPVAEAGDWNTRLWIAQARLRCGEALKNEEAARASVAAARDALQGLIARAEREASFAPKPSAVLAARLRLAECQRELGEHQAAVETLAKMLDGGPTLLDVQRVAAQTLQEWGEATQDTERLEQAIAGARPGSDGKNILWGWSKLASVAGRFAARDPRRKPLFFEAWREVAASRYQLALLASGADRAEQLRKAAGTIVALQRQHPELGGGASRAAFDRLLREIQTASGEEASGLASLGG